APFDPPREFVAVGPYRFVRNPMYVGGIALLFGAGLVLGSFSIVLLSFFAFAASHLLVILYEEPVLTRRFGESYVRYKASVSRWLVRRPGPGTP
ncbi:MAG TPA: PEMT/PEM2 methyltransferase family protein, partial [Thermoanaerobaculia bacterium]|nr:PEMT/PEM2 methyltransferase family protein [Thermoanaerobaculia bacterium]